MSSTNGHEDKRVAIVTGGELNGGPTVLALLAFVLWTALAGAKLAHAASRAPAPAPAQVSVPA